MFTLTKNASAIKNSMRIKNLAGAEKQAIRKAFYDLGKILVADTREEINKKPKSGRRYVKYQGVKGRLKKPQYYNASAPGEAPAVVTGTLRKSINFTVSGASEMKFGVDLSRGDASYGKYLEHGNLLAMSGQGSKNIKPRPYISAAFAKNKNNIERKFSAEIAQALNR